MITFKHFLRLNEGGNAVKGVVAINQENSIATLNKALKELGRALKISTDDMASLGSTGKKAPGQKSGDIDLAISAPALLKNNNLNSYSELMDYIVAAVKKLDYEYRDMRNLGIISLGYPIVNKDGRQGDEIVQLDLMVVDSVDYAKWAYFSPSYLESNLKGLYRNELNIAVAKYAGFDVSKVDDDTKTPIEWRRFWFDLRSGLHKGRQSRLSPKTGKVVKTPTTYDKELITSSPEEIVAFLYGSRYKPNDILTFEQAFKAVMSKSFPHAKRRKEILKMTAQGIQNKGYPVPNSLAKVI
jgi:hypothetical protein